MRESYKAHDIELWHSNCGTQQVTNYEVMWGDTMCAKGYTTDLAPLHDAMVKWKMRVDKELRSTDPWGLMAAQRASA